MANDGLRGGGSRQTLESVAAAVGVSKATVSKVLNGRADVGPATRLRVLDAIRDLGYEPTTGPRPGHAPRMVNVVFDSLVSVYTLQVLDGILAGARENGIEVAVDVLPPTESKDGALTAPWIRSLAERDRVGLIVVTSTLDAGQVAACRDAGLGLVWIDPLEPLSTEVVSVSSANWRGGVQATEHLLGLGHVRIGLAGGPSNSSAARERLHGYRSAHEIAGVPIDEALVLSGAFTWEAGVAMTSRLLGLPAPPTAIFAGSDATALGALEAARAHGVRVPEDLSIVGFDDTYAAMSSAPPLTTVRQPIYEMGRVALRTVLGLARGAVPDSTHVELSTSLVVRESTAPPRAAETPLRVRKDR